jgi:hypothetical protein
MYWAEGNPNTPILQYSNTPIIRAYDEAFIQAKRSRN